MRAFFVGGVCAAVSIAMAATAVAKITEIRIDLTEPFADGASYGAAGAYVRIKGVAKGELDPKSPQNAVIADLDKAPVNARGMVEYETDFFILRPADPAKGSGVLFYEVVNRGQKFLFPWLEEARAAVPVINDPKLASDAGLGFTLGRGYSLVWSGWDPDAPTANNGLVTRVPMAMENGKPVTRRIREEILIGTRGPADVTVARLAYPAASTDKSKARLTVRSKESDTRTEIPADQWDFVDNRSIKLLPEGAKFTPIRIHELWYEATAPKIVGIGYAATRDLVSFLRNEKADAKGTPNPMLSAAGQSAVRHTLAFGISQSGRYLRHHVELGMNKDEGGKRVFDGVLAHISGAGKVFANHTFAMPGRTATQHEDRYYPENWFPFSAATTTDPVSGRTAALLRGDASDPLLMETNSSTEYWQKGASLLHIDPAGKADLTLPANARAYLIAGTMHAGRANVTPTAGACANLSNPHNPAPALRALVAALEDWVVRGTAPPPSRVPTLAQRNAVDAGSAAMPVVKDFVRASGGNRLAPPVDWIDPPASGVTNYPTHVSAVDADGNETAGIRLPPIAVPLATYTGWNEYRAVPGELCDRTGSYLPFAKTKADRDAAADPRQSVQERYASRAEYVAKVKAAADMLAAERLLLPADVAAYVTAAEASDRF